MVLITQILGVAAITFSTTAAQTYPNHARIHARSHGQLQQRGAPPMTCACSTDGIVTSTTPAVSVITVIETETQNAPSEPTSTVFVTISPSGSVSTVTRYISDGTTIPAETITIIEREDIFTVQPSIITVTATQSPPGNNYHVITVTATQDVQPTVTQASSQTDGDLGVPTDSSTPVGTPETLSSPPTTASPTVPGNYHYCHSRTCYNTRGDVVTTLAPMTTDALGCSADAVSVVMETVYNTVTQTVYGLPTGGAGNSTGPGSGSDTNSTVTLMPRGARVPSGIFGKLRGYYH
ncbi:hypothetical protein MCOR27_003258 [Pyricularia oryzae]|uniref:Uncharacterized protein n=2 Tax=Pyricularia TaxID=48558 RepID=A0ABQ8NQ68_PYRGI|nr:hypothetical protein MCOR01_011626 [Pyricularia oryzae]KAI6300498.1 hypothetical protein MCOR33_003772 [Pyricularia grisea]KAH9439973.1 hypothetical protein MCOR02_003506 [Pyricularia oryzae]KAI6260819.1 hypothetical protein MCOR19_002916 [Pyricularia oryzae]KAI6268304.1 hypothetical protein MCOR26_009264 [Pyricularia oryzae]